MVQNFIKFGLRMKETINKIFSPHPIDKYSEVGITKYSKEITESEMNELLNESQMSDFKVIDEMKKLFFYEDYYLYYFYRGHQKVIILGKDPDFNINIKPYEE